VDVMVTMNDPSIPLTVTEYEEWGNPADEQFYEYMLSYSPIDNVKAQAYPAMLVTTGLNDSRYPPAPPTHSSPIIYPTPDLRLMCCYGFGLLRSVAV
jgi:hypothetical protein